MDDAELLRRCARASERAREAEVEAAREQGRLEQLRKEAREAFGTDDEKKLRRMLKEEEAELAEAREELERLLGECDGG